MGKPQVTYVASNEAFNKSLDILLTTPKEIPISLDVEASSLDCFTGTLILLQIGTKEWINVYDVRHIDDSKIVYLLELLQTRLVVGHNIKFDLKYILEKYGILLKKVHDTMVVHAILVCGVGNHFPSYHDLVKKCCMVEIEKETRSKFQDNPKVQITPDVLNYAVRDVLYIPYIFDEQREELLKKKSKKVYDLEMELLPVVTRMEHNGVLLDTEKWLKLEKIAKQNMKELSQKMTDQIIGLVVEAVEQNDFEDGREMLEYFNVTLVGEFNRVAYKREYLSEVHDVDEMKKVFLENFNANSVPQMLRIMNLMGIDTDSTASKVLKRDHSDNEFAQILVEFREWTKKYTSFGRNFLEHINPKTGRIHSNYDQLATATGRFASSDPNLQNILKDVDYRNCFIAREGYLIGTYDYSQIELRIAAEASNEEEMLRPMREGKNLHADTARAIFHVGEDESQEVEVYTKAKSANFAILYGTSAKGLAYNFQIPWEDGKEILERHKLKYPNLHAFIDLVREQILARGYSVTPFGRRRYFTIPKRWTRYNFKEKFKIFREGFNHVVQGGSADMIKLSMIWIDQRNPFGDKLRLLMQVHDEIVVEIAKDIEKEADAFIREQMIKAGEVFVKSVPVDVGGEIHPYWTK